MSTRHIYNLIKWVIVTQITLLPLIVTPHTVYPFVFGKTLFLHATAILLVLCMCALGCSRAHRKHLYTAVKNPLVQIWVVGIALATISSVLGSDISQSFWSTQERGMGIVFMVEVLITIVALHISFKTKKDIIVYTRAIVISGVVTTFIAFTRLAGITLFGVDTGLRISGTLANPIYYGGAAIIYLFFSWHGYLNDHAEKTKKWYLVAALILLIGIIHTQTRGVIIALVAGIGVYALLKIQSTKHGKRMVAVAGIVSLCVLGVIFQFHKQIDQANIPVLDRIVSTKLTDGSITTRFAAWQAGLKAWKHKPILGWGQEQFTVAFDSEFPASITRYGFVTTRFDRAHNIIIEQLVTGGICGLMWYIALFLIPAMIMLKKEKNSNSFAVLAILVAYNIHLLFAFDTALSTMLIISALFIITRTEKKDPLHEENIPLFATAIMILLCVLAVSLVVFSYQASVQTVKALSFTHTQQYETSYEQLVSSLHKITPYKTETRNEAVRLAMSVVGGNVIDDDLQNKIIQLALEEADNNIIDHPNESFFQYFKGLLLLKLGSTNSLHIKTAQTYFEKAYEQSKRQQYLYALSDALSMAGEHEEALKILEKAAEDSNQVPLSQWYVALKNMELGNTEKGEQIILDLAENGYEPSDQQPREDKEIIAQILRKHEKHKQALMYFSFMFENGDEIQAQRWAQLAVFAQEAGAFASAAQAADIAAQLDSSFVSEVETFKELLGAIPQTDDFLPRIEELIGRLKSKTL